MNEHEHHDEPRDVSQQRYDHGAETALLSACLWSKNARTEARKAVLPTDFLQPLHERIYNAMTMLDRSGMAVDPVTVRTAVTQDGGVLHPSLERSLVEITTGAAVPEHAADYAKIVRGWALRRRIEEAAVRLRQRAMSTSETPERLAAEAVTMLAGLRDAGTDVTALSLGELMHVPDDTPKWVIPELLEAGDRLMLTGTEGVGKSALSRQISIMAASGIHPFTNALMPPIKALIVDCENKPAQVRRQTRPLLAWLHDHAHGAQDPTERVLIDTPGRISITRDRDLSRIHQTIDAWQPDVVVMGPIYRMSDRALQTDDEAAPFLAALDTITARGCALVLEAHAGHTASGVGRQQQRDLRPRGSSSLMGWPEFGLGLRGLGGGIADLEPWRGGREARAWPSRMRQAPGNRWVETYPDDRPVAPTHPPGGSYYEPPEPAQQTLV